MRLIGFPLHLLPWLISLSGCTAEDKPVLPGFKDPANDYRPKFRYWLPDASVPAESVVRDVKAISAVGAGGLEFLPFYGYGTIAPESIPTDWHTYGFGTEAFKELFVSALSASNEAKLRFDFAVGASQGQGVPAEPGSDGLAMELTYGTVSINGGDVFRGSLPGPQLNYNYLPGFMNPPGSWGANELIAVVAAGIRTRNTFQAVIDESTLSDLTASVVNNSLEWTAPSQYSSYTLFAFYQRHSNQRSVTTNPNAETVIANGSWVVDHFSASGAQKITDFLDQNLLDDPSTKDLLRATGEYSWEDSNEFQSALYWTKDFVKRFEANRGYSPNKYLPIYFNVANQWNALWQPYNTTYVLDSGAAGGEKYLQDYRLTLDEGYTEYLTHYQKWATSLGLSHSAQPAYNLPLDVPRHVPEVAVPELESLGFPTIDSALHFVGAAHLSGRNVISTEVGAVASGSYTQTIPSLVALFKDSFAAGVNMMVIHGYPYSGEYINTTWPGYDPFVYAYTECWNERQPAWRHMNDSLAYAARNSLVLQTGVPRVDLAFYTFAQHELDAVETSRGDDQRAAGYSYEYLGPMNLVSDDAVVRDKTLAPDGPAYRALVINNETYITAALSAKLLDFAAGGLPIFIIGNVPNITIGTKDQANVSSNMQTLLSDYPSVQRLNNISALTQALQINQVKPRASILNNSASGKFFTFWRSDTERNVELVYLYNRGADASVDFAFQAASDSVPYVLDAWTGEQNPLLVYENLEGTLATTVSLKSNQTAILAFSKSQTQSLHVVSHSENVEEFQLNDNGQIEALVDSGTADVLLSNGDRKIIPESAAASSNLTLDKWNLTVESYGPASNESSSRTSITTIDAGELSSLRPWTNIPGLQNVSGVGIYTSTFDLDDVSVGNETATKIRFGPVLNSLRAWVNGELLPPVDVIDPELEISRWVVSGKNQIKIETSSTLVNAVKANIGTVRSIGVPPQNTQPYANYVDYGLVGPVTIRTLRKVVVS